MKIVRFRLDEAASLEKFPVLEDAVDKYRSYGVRMMFIYQSIGQLKKCWNQGADQTLMSNTTQIFFAVNDKDTAEYVSVRLGKETIIVDSGGTSSSQSQSHSSATPGSSLSYGTNGNCNWQQSGRELLQPSEVTALDQRVAITLAPGTPPILTRLSRFYERERKWVEGARVLVLSALLFGITIAGFLFLKERVRYVGPPMVPRSQGGN